MVYSWGIDKMSKDLTKLKELVDDLTDLGDLVTLKRPGMSEYRTLNSKGKKTTAKATALLSERAVGVMRFWTGKGESIEAHQHAEAEGIIVISGSFRTLIRNNRTGKEFERIVGPGEGVYYAPEDEHYGTVIEDLDCICVSVPRAAGYPDGE
jgi:quercetin dioxygenase-like cupin family protein